MTCKHINASGTFTIETMMISHANLKDPLECHFSGLTQKMSSIHLLWKPKVPKSALNSRPFISENFPDTEKLNFAQLLQKYSYRKIH